MNGTKAMRRSRALNIGVLAIEVALFGFDLAIGSSPLVIIIPLVWAVAFIAVICWQTKKIRRLEYEARPRPDYAAIARMERDVYGREFEHDGAPEHLPIPPKCPDCNGRHRKHRAAPFEDDRRAMRALAAARRSVTLPMPRMRLPVQGNPC